jgi:hypothetical protein
MTWIDEKLTHQFYSWELRGRGWQVFDSPVHLEPVFREFPGYCLPAQPVVDDGRIATRLSSFLDAFRAADEEPLEAEDAIEPYEPPETFDRDKVAELQVTLPRDSDPSPEVFEHFLFNVHSCDDPVSFEVIGAGGNIMFQLAASLHDIETIRHALDNYFPSAVVTQSTQPLATLWSQSVARHPLIIEFGLKDEFMIPIASRRRDFFVALTAAFSALTIDEVAVFQVLFIPVRHAWAVNALRCVSDDQGKPFFSNRPELLTAAKNKIARPLYAAVMRVAALSDDPERSSQIATRMSAILESFGDPNGNSYVALDSTDYPPAEQEHDLLKRQSRRPGMLLNSNELLLTVHLPSAAVQTPRLVRQVNKTHSAPASVQAGDGVLLGSNTHVGHTIEVRLTAGQRVRHTQIVGAPGSGKSTLMFNMIRQDIEQGAGVALLDPHGDLAESILDVVPASRVNDMIYVDPADPDYSIGFNVLAAPSDLEKTLLASDLGSIFQRLSTSWGDQMNSVLQNAILAFVESDRGGTLSDLRRFLLDPAYRTQFLTTVRDPEIVYYWQKAFPQLAGNRSIGPILTRLETFLSPKPIRAMVSQSRNRLDFSAMMDTGKIFIAKLSQGQIGRDNAYLLGSLFVSKFQQAAMARQNQPEAQRRDFWMYIDEFDHFITPSMAEILTGARKYHVGMTLAHQDLTQLHRDHTVGSAVLSTHVRIVFRVNDADARALGEGFANFKSDDLRNLDIGNAICRVERSDYDFNLRVPLPGELNASAALAPRDQVIAASRAKYAALRSDIEKSYRAPIQPTKSQIETPAVVAPATHEIAETVEQAPATVSKTSVLKPEAAAQPQVPKPLGKGGQQHIYLQQLIKQWAQGMGYMAVIEEALPAGGLIDVALKKPQRSIACEISVTTPATYEIGNVRKCLAAGYDFVVMVGTDQRRVAALEKAIAPDLATEELAKVRFLMADGLFALIERLDASDATREETVRGYRVKVSHQVVDQTTKEDRMKILAKVVADSLKPKK